MSNVFIMSAPAVEPDSSKVIRIRGPSLLGVELVRESRDVLVQPLLEVGHHPELMVVEVVSLSGSSARLKRRLRSSQSPVLSSPESLVVLLINFHCPLLMAAVGGGVRSWWGKATL